MDSLLIMENLSNKSEQFRYSKFDAYGQYGSALNKTKTIKGFSNSMNDKIIQAALENELPVHENSDLVKMLAKLDILKSIPSEYYKVVAEIMSYIYRMDDLKKSTIADEIR